MKDTQQRTAAQQFANDWKGKGYEKGETARFWIQLLQNVFGIAEPTKFICFEERVKDINTNFIYACISAAKGLIEQKSIDKDLCVLLKQSDGFFFDGFPAIDFTESNCVARLFEMYEVLVNNLK